MKTIWLSLFVILSINLEAQEPQQFVNVLATNGLNMRSEPEENARVVAKVAYGKKVQVLNKTDSKLKLGWLSDNWYKVRYRGREGFIYGAYLSEWKAPKDADDIRLSELLSRYCSSSYTTERDPINTIELDDNADTVKHVLVSYEGGVELEIEQENDRSTSTLILEASIQQAYVLLESLLKKAGINEKLDALRFVQDSSGQLIRVNNSDGTISVKPYSAGKVSIRIVAYKEVN